MRETQQSSVDSDILELKKIQFWANQNINQLHNILVDTALEKKREEFSIKAKRKWMRNKKKIERNLAKVGWRLRNKFSPRRNQ